jgi:hypothetical protein
VVGGEWTYFWPVWVAGPWGALLVVRSIRGVLDGEPQRWAAKQARKEAEREVRRQAIKRELTPDADAPEADPDRDQSS